MTAKKQNAGSAARGAKRPVRSTTAGTDGRRGASGKTHPRSHALAQQIDLVIEQRLNEVGDELKELVRSEFGSWAEKKSADPCSCAEEPSGREKARISQAESGLRREMEKRLKEIETERSRLDPAYITNKFKQQIPKILEGLVGVDSPALNDHMSNALRQAVLDSFRTRRQHLSHLTKLDLLVRSGSADQLPRILQEFFAESGVKRVATPEDNPEYFKAENSPEGGRHLQVVEPALIDEFTGQILRAGVVTHVAEPPVHNDSSDGEAYRGGES